ncbi:MAG: universal stress protein [Acidobacteriota bacterium]
MEKPILFAVDGSESCCRSLQAIGRLLRGNPFSIRLYHCVPNLQALYPGALAPMTEGDAYLGKLMERAGYAILEDAGKCLVKNGFPKDLIEYGLKCDSSVPSCDILNECGESGVRTVACGRRGKTPKEALLIGSVASRLAQYSHHRTVWIADCLQHETRKALIAIDGVPDSRALTYYAAEFLAPIPDMHFTLLHLMPIMPARFWDHGHILNEREEQEKESSINKWSSENMRDVEQYLHEARDALIQCGVEAERIQVQVKQTSSGVAKDLLNEIDRNKYQLIMLKKKRDPNLQPFLIGSNANKILKNAGQTIVCLVD